MNSQKIAFMLAFSQAKAGRNVKLSKENGLWIVKIKG